MGVGRQRDRYTSFLYCMLPKSCVIEYFRNFRSSGAIDRCCFEAQNFEVLQNTVVQTKFSSKQSLFDAYMPLTAHSAVLPRRTARDFSQRFGMDNLRDALLSPAFWIQVPGIARIRDPIVARTS